MTHSFARLPESDEPASTTTQPDPLRFEPLRVTVPRKNSLIVIVWMFVAIVVAMLAFSYYSLGLLSAARAFVGAEGLWSKAQKEAVYMLSRYILYRNPVDFIAFQASLAVNLGDERTRHELEKRQPDMAVAVAGFAQGRNHPDDIDGMIKLFHNFRNLAEIEKAIRIWAQADAHIHALLDVGNRINTAIQAGTLSTTQTQQFLQELDYINKQVTPLEDDFSYTLGQASRRAKALLMFTMFIAVGILLTFAFMLSRHILRQAEAAQSALRESENQLRGLLQFAPLPLIIVRLSDQTIIYANDPALHQLRITQSALGHIQSRNFYVRGEEHDDIMAVVQEHSSIRDREVQLKDVQDKSFWALISTRLISYGGEKCLLTALNNIEERQRAHNALHHRAFHDELTGLPNRAMFLEALRRTISNTQRKNSMFSILFIDLDHFKQINDSLGHDIGDQLLQSIASRLRASMREGDIVARLGGDEFVVLIEDLDGREDVVQVAQKIREALKPSCMLSGQPVNMTLSIGISTYPQDGTELNQLLKSADAAMYQAKKQGRDNFQFYTRASQSAAPTKDLSAVNKQPPT